MARSAEIGELSERKKLEARLAVSDRMASIGTLAAGVAHEINNPLAALMGYLELAAHALEGAEFAKAGEIAGLLDSAGEAAERVRRTVKDLKLLSRPDDDRDSCVDLKDAMESALRMAWNEIRHRATVVKSYSPDVPCINAHESRIGQVFLNLLVNAAQSIPSGNASHNEIRVSTRLQGQSIAVEVSDSGAGIKAEQMGRIFEHFYSTKESSGNMGIGLAICKGIVEGMGGRLTVSSRPGLGSSFTLLLPLSLAAEAPPQAPGPKAAPAGRRGRVLLINDEAGLLEIMRLNVSREHEALASSDPRGALELLASGEAFDAILCDMMMPEMTGMEFYRHLKRSDPGQAAKVIFISGGAFAPPEQDFMDSTAQRYLEKPFSRAALLAAVRSVVGP